MYVFTLAFSFLEIVLQVALCRLCGVLLFFNDHDGRPCRRAAGTDTGHRQRRVCRSRLGLTPHPRRLQLRLEKQERLCPRHSFTPVSCSSPAKEPELVSAGWASRPSGPPADCKEASVASGERPGRTLRSKKTVKV